MFDLTVLVAKTSISVVLNAAEAKYYHQQFIYDRMAGE